LGQFSYNEAIHKTQVGKTQRRITAVGSNTVIGGQSTMNMSEEEVKKNRKQEQGKSIERHPAHFNRILSHRLKLSRNGKVGVIPELSKKLLGEKGNFFGANGGLILSIYLTCEWDGSTKAKRAQGGWA